MSLLWKQAHKEDPELAIGDVVEEQMDSVEFGRIAAQTAKQVILQKVREAEREQVVEMYEDRIGEVLSGIVKRVESEVMFLLMWVVALKPLYPVNMVFHARKSNEVIV